MGGRIEFRRPEDLGIEGERKDRRDVRDYGELCGRWCRRKHNIFYCNKKKVVQIEMASTEVIATEHLSVLVSYAFFYQST